MQLVQKDIFVTNDITKRGLVNNKVPYFQIEKMDKKEHWNKNKTKEKKTITMVTSYQTEQNILGTKDC